MHYHNADSENVILTQLGMAVHICNLNIHEAEAGGLL